MKIVIIGQIIFSKKITEFLIEKGHDVDVYDYAKIRLIKEYNFYFLIRKADIIYFFNGFSLNNFFRSFYIRYILRKKIFIHFIGSDALKFLNYNHKSNSNWFKSLKLAHQVFGISTNIVNELSPYMNIKYLPLCFDDLDYNFHKFPEKFTVLLYVPPSNPDFYGFQIYKRLIANNLDINFVILGDDYDNISNYKNTKIIPIDYNINMGNVYNNCSVLIRLTEHDGLSNMVLESLARGRHVIWTSKFNYCRYSFRDLESVQYEIDYLKNIPDNKNAISWIKENYNKDRLLGKLENYLCNYK